MPRRSNSSSVEKKELEMDYPPIEQDDGTVAVAAETEVPKRLKVTVEGEKPKRRASRARRPALLVEEKVPVAPARRSRRVKQAESAKAFEPVAVPIMAEPVAPEPVQVARPETIEERYARVVRQAFQEKMGEVPMSPVMEQSIDKSAKIADEHAALEQAEEARIQAAEKILFDMKKAAYIKTVESALAKTPGALETVDRGLLNERAEKMAGQVVKKFGLEERIKNQRDIIDRAQRGEIPALMGEMALKAMEKLQAESKRLEQAEKKPVAAVEKSLVGDRESILKEIEDLSREINACQARIDEVTQGNSSAYYEAEELVNQKMELLARRQKLGRLAEAKVVNIYPTEEAIMKPAVSSQPSQPVQRGGWLGRLAAKWPFWRH